MTPKTVITTEIIDALLDALAERLAPRIIAAMASPAPAPETDPDETWGTADVCEHLGIAQSTLRDRQKLPSFPKRVNLAGRPRWLASDIRTYRRGSYSK